MGIGSCRKIIGIGLIVASIGSVILASTLLLRYGPDRTAVGSYEETCRWIRSERDRMSNGDSSHATHESRLRAARDLWFQVTVDRIFPAWYGTPWDFNGVAGEPAPGLPGASATRIDRDRKVACGHFVGSVMEDLGFNVNRKAVGRQAAADIIHSFVSDPGLIRSFRNAPRAALFDDITKMGRGLFIVGLDSHVGFIVSDADGLHFVHASGRFPFCVLREPARTAVNLVDSRLVMVGKFSDDQQLAESWLNGRRIHVKGGR